MTPPAVSQILERFVGVIAMVVLAYLLLPYGLTCRRRAAFGAIPGSLAGLVVLSYFYHRARKTWQAKSTDKITESEGKVDAVG